MDLINIRTFITCAMRADNFKLPSLKFDIFCFSINRFGLTETPAGLFKSGKETLFAAAPLHRGVRAEARPKVAINDAGGPTPTEPECNYFVVTVRYQLLPHTGTAQQAEQKNRRVAESQKFRG